VKTAAEKMTKTGAIMGRPVKWPPEHPVWREIIGRVSAGKALSTVLTEPGYPTWGGFHAMIDQDAELKMAYEKAVQDRADKLADEILQLSDEQMPAGLEGAMASAWVQQKRMQVDARKWIASKLKPRTYGDRIDMTVRDERISVLGALEAAQARVQTLQLDNVTDITPKVVDKSS
jgi:hypothetical protein